MNDSHSHQIPYSSQGKSGLITQRNRICASHVQVGALRFEIPVEVRIVTAFMFQVLYSPYVFQSMDNLYISFTDYRLFTPWYIPRRL